MTLKIHLNFLAIVQQCVAQIVQFGKIDTQIRHFQHVLNVIGIWILDGHIRWQHPENDFALMGWFDVWIALIAHNIRHIFRRTSGKRKRLVAIVCEVTVHMPRSTKIVWTLDQHGGRSERLKYNDQMRKMEFGFQIQLNGDIFFAIFRLPPRCRSCARLRFVDHLTDAMI